MIRCFVAVDLSDPVREKLRSLQNSMRQFGAPLRFTDPAGIHLTLKFLGAVAEDVVERVRRSLNECEPPGTFEFRVAGLGAFPNLAAPRVFWIGIEAPPALLELQRRVEAALLWMGVSEERPFHPHLTLARAKGPKGLDRLIDYIKINAGSVDAGTVAVRGFHLFHSILGSSGAQYVKLASFSLV